MTDQADTNAAIWKSAEAVKSFAAQADQRERERREQLLFVARLLPFKRTDAFTFLDLGAGINEIDIRVIHRACREIAVEWNA